MKHLAGGVVSSSTVRRTMLGAAALSALAAPPALAVEGPQGVRPGHNITVFHNIDFVATFGQAVGGQVRVEVFRGPHRIASSQGAAVNAAPDGGALEVNHGPVGAPRPGDCWVGATPDIRPGDRIVVSNPDGQAGVDEAIVDHISMTAPRAVHVDAGGAEQPAPGPTTHPEVWVEGTANFAAPDGGIGAPIAAADLNSGEFRDPADGKLRVTPTAVEEPAGPGTFRARYDSRDLKIARNGNGRSDAAILSALTADGHAMGVGHVVPLPAVGMLVDGAGEASGPALGCEGSPKASSSLGALSTETLNVANAGAGAADPLLEAGGWAAGATAPGTAELTISDGVTTNARLVTLSDHQPQKGWSAALSRSDLAGLEEGSLTLALRVDGTLVGATRTVRYDVTAPTVSASLAEGTHQGDKDVVLTAGNAADPITYQLDGGPQSPYFGGPIPLRLGKHTLLVRSTDAAGNSTSRTLSYAIEAAPAPGAPVRPTAGANPVLGATPVAATPAVAQTRAVALVAKALAGSRTLRLSSVRRSGVLAAFTAPDGARTAVIRVLLRRGGRLTVVGSQTATVRPGVNRIRLRSKSLRGRLRSGTYVIEVRLRGADGIAGVPAGSTVRIVR